MDLVIISHVGRAQDIEIVDGERSRSMFCIGPRFASARSGMNILEFTFEVAPIALAAGYLGSLTGLGGGVVITRVLVLLLGVDMRYGIGATLVSVIATSSGAAAAYVREGFSNVRSWHVPGGCHYLRGNSGCGTRNTDSHVIAVDRVRRRTLYSAWLSSRPEPDTAG